MWARVKAETEAALRPPTVCWRPSYIHAVHDRDTIPGSEKFMRLLYPLFRWSRSMVVRANEIGYAMIQAQRAGIREGVIGALAWLALDVVVGGLGLGYTAAAALKLADEMEKTGRWSVAIAVLDSASRDYPGDPAVEAHRESMLEHRASDGALLRG